MVYSSVLPWPACDSLAMRTKRLGVAALIDKLVMVLRSALLIEVAGDRALHLRQPGRTRVQLGHDLRCQAGAGVDEVGDGERGRLKQALGRGGQVLRDSARASTARKTLHPLGLGAEPVEHQRGEEVVEAPEVAVQETGRDRRQEPWRGSQRK
jgi:hypothetical protein